MTVRPLLFLIFLLLLVAAGTATAQTAADQAELSVNGPDGAQLFVDGKPAGTLPISENLVLPAGAHRFRLEKGTLKAESDVLSLQGNRHAELNLTMTGRNLVAVLYITPGLLLHLQPSGLPPELVARLTQAVGAAARQGHAVLISGAKEAALLRRESELERCLTGGACDALFGQDSDVAYVLSVRLEREPATQAISRLGIDLLDVRTNDFSARAAEPVGVARTDALAGQLKQLATRLLQETEQRPRTTLAASSTPEGAQVILDGRLLGKTPLEHEIFVGARSIVIQREGYEPATESVLAEIGQQATIKAELHPAPQKAAPQKPPAGRPLWRLVTGGAAVGAGLLLIGFGGSALASNGRCQDGSDNTGACPFYSTLTVGGGLVGAGAALTIGGAILLALPGL